MEDDIRTFLLESIAAERLVILTGAGLSMASPSEVPSAVELAAGCVARHQGHTTEDLSDLLDKEDPLGAVASHFYSKDRLKDYFIPKLIDWAPFHGPSNEGHEALADLLSCGAIDTVVTTNVDQLVEQAARKLGSSAFRGACDGQQAGEPGAIPFLKVHGCCHLNRKETLWCKDQLDEPEWEERLDASKTWLAGHLMERDLVVIGFWTDWSYLLSALSGCLSGTEPAKVLIVNLDGEECLQEKAPQLWAWVDSEGVEYELVPMSGEAFLECLRKAFAEVFLRQLLGQAGAGSDTVPLADLSPEVAYDLRRDWTGVPRNAPVKRSKTDESWNRTAEVISEAMESGAELDGGHLRAGDNIYRVIHAPGQHLSSVRARYRHEPADPVFSPTLVAVGVADDGPVPAHLTRGSTTSTIVRSGHPGPWITDGEFLETLVDAEEE